MDWKDSVRLAPSDIVKKAIYFCEHTENVKIVLLLLKGLSIALDMTNKMNMFLVLII